MYNYSITIRDKEVKFRKWKVKDKNKFLSNILEEPDNNIIMNALVYDCLEDDNIALSLEEYKYVLSTIRKESISDDIEYEFTCPKCNHEYTYNTKISEIMRMKAQKYGKISCKDVSFKMGEIKNKKLYLEAINIVEDNREKEIIDFLFHVEELNGSDAFTFDYLYDFIEELDLDIAMDIFKQWNEMKFSIDDVNVVRCPECSYEEEFKFNFIPNFFPESWFE